MFDKRCVPVWPTCGIKRPWMWSAQFPYSVATLILKYSSNFDSKMEPPGFLNGENLLTSWRTRTLLFGGWLPFVSNVGYGSKWSWLTLKHCSVICLFLKKGHTSLDSVECRITGMRSGNSNHYTGIFYKLYTFYERVWNNVVFMWSLALWLMQSWMSQ